MLYYRYKEVLAMKKLISVTLSFIISLGMLFVVSACQEESSTPTEEVWTTAYTEEEHIERLERELTYYWQAVENGAVIDVDIVYSFDNLPKYFLVSIQLAEGGRPTIYTNTETPYEVKQTYIIGSIKNDKYYYGTTFINRKYIPGPSPWHYLGYKDEKKYFGKYTFAIEQDGELLQIYQMKFMVAIDHKYGKELDNPYWIPPEDFAGDFTQRILPEEEKKEVANWCKENEFYLPFRHWIYPDEIAILRIYGNDDGYIF